MYKLIKIWNKVSLYFRISFYRSCGITIGKNTFISRKAYVDITRPNWISIGNNCFITRNCVVLSHSVAQGRKQGKVKIGNNVFIGVNSVIMPNVTIGDNVVIGAMSLVKKDIPSNCVAYGIPAKRVRSLK